MENPPLYESGFKKRLSAMVGLAGLWADEFGEGETVSKLLNEFGHFACSYFKEISHEISEETSPDVFNSALNRLQKEWVTISMACQQRKVTQLAVPLKEADDQANRYYNAFKGFNIKNYSTRYKPDVVPIAYFEKVYAITRYAFTPYPLVSIPSQSMRSPDQWQALAHEMGHHLYWNAAPLEHFEEIQNQIKEAVQEAIIEDYKVDSYGDLQDREKVVEIWNHWLEETFADVAGVLFSGPSYVASCIEIAKQAIRGRVDRLLEDDGEHPSWYIRPWIAIDTLRWVADAEKLPKKHDLYGKISDFEADWQGNKRVEEVNDHRLVHPDTNVQMEKVKEVVAAVTSAILSKGVRLGACINYRALWLDVSEPVAVAFAATLDPIFEGLRRRTDEIFDDESDREGKRAFAKLRDFLEKKVRAEVEATVQHQPLSAELKEKLVKEGLHRALLAMQLSDEDLQLGCFTANVHYVNGDLQLCI